MSSFRLATPLAATALSLLLAACGGGSDNSSANTAVSASPSAPSSSSASTNDSAAPRNGATLRVPSPSGSSPEAVASSGTSNTDGSGNANSGDANSTNNTSDTNVNNTAAGPATTQVAAAISASGIRGDVLLTMLDQIPCKQDLSETSSTSGPAYPRDQNEVSDAKVQFSLDPGNYSQNPDFQQPPNGATYLSRPCGAFVYHPAAAGSYTLNVASSAFSRTAPEKLNKGFNSVNLTPQLTIASGSATLSAKMAGNAYRDLRPYPDDIQQRLTPTSEDLTFVAKSGDFSFKLTDQIAFGQVIRQWEGGKNSVQLMILPGQTNQVQLCWNIDTLFVKRLQCQVWQVPDNWRRGQQLQDIDQYVVDQRNVYPNENGQRYFRTAVEPAS